MPIPKTELFIPVVEIPAVTGIPRYSFKEGLQKMPGVARRYGESLGIESEQHEAFSLRPVSKHHPRVHDVFWVLEKQQGTDPFGSWQSLVTDEPMLVQLEEQFRETVDTSDTIIYTLQGCEPLDESLEAVSWPQGPLWPGGLASLPYVHFHQVGQVEQLDITSIYQYPELSQGEDEKVKVGDHTHTRKEVLLSGLFNQAGEEAIFRYGAYLDQVGYGERQVFEQVVGLDTTLPIQRTVYGFNSLAEAAQKSYQVRSLVAESWITTALAIFEDTLKLEAASLRAMQGVVPSFALVMLPESLRQEYQLPYPVITFPFTVTHPLPALTKGGVLIQRN